MRLHYVSELCYPLFFHSPSDERAIQAPLLKERILGARYREIVEVLSAENIARSLDQKVAEATTTVLQSAANIFLGNIWELGAGGMS